MVMVIPSLLVFSTLYTKCTKYYVTFPSFFASRSNGEQTEVS
jgi:hypothetical protein